MNISDEAVDAAAMAILGVTPDVWEMQTPRTKGRYLADARTALEAATPHIVAPLVEALRAERARTLMLLEIQRTPVESARRMESSK